MTWGATWEDDWDTPPGVVREGAPRHHEMRIRSRFAAQKSQTSPLNRAGARPQPGQGAGLLDPSGLTALR
jgi:hypothetical protein